MQKQCSRCFQVQPFSEFFRRSGSIDGYVGVCKHCKREQADTRGDATKNRLYQAEWYAENRGRVTELRRQRRIEQKDVIQEKYRAWYDADPERARMMYRAKNAVGRAVRAGHIVKPTACEECGTTNTVITGAHSDYTQPLLIRWLCWSCHNRWDRANPKLR